MAATTKKKTTKATNGTAPETAKIRFHVDGDRLTVGQIMDLEDAQSSGTSSMTVLANILVAFVVDEAGEPLPEDEAMAQLRELTMGQLMAAMDGIGDAIGNMAANPPTASA